MIDVILLHVIIFGSSLKCIFWIAGAAELSKNVRAKCWKSCFRGFRFQNFPAGMSPDPLEKSRLRRGQPNLQQSDLGLDSPLVRVSRVWNTLPDKLRKPDISLSKFKSLLFEYYFCATIYIFDIEKQQSWKSVSLKCHQARQLAASMNCCF